MILNAIVRHRRVNLCILIASAALFQASSSTAQTLRSWTGLGGDANWSTAANWNGGAPTNGDRLTFSGTTQQNNFNDLSSYTNGSITFSNSGFNLSGNGITIGTGITNLVGTNVINFPIAVETAGTKVWATSLGSELQLFGQVTSAGTPQQDFGGGGGVLRLRGGMTLSSTPLLRLTDCIVAVDGCTLNTLGGIRIGYSTFPTTGQLVITNGGEVDIGGGSALRVGETAAGTVTISSGVLNVTGTGGIHLGQTGTGNGTITQTGGEVKTTVAGIVFSVAGSGDGTYNLNGGTLTAVAISKTASGTATMNFGGGTLKPWVSTNNFLSGLNTASIKSGGLIIDTDFSDITVSQKLSGSGPLIKNNEGALTLTGTNTHSGSITLNGGKLFLTTARTGSGAITISDSTEFGVSITAAGSGVLTSDLTLGSVSGCTLDFNLGIFGNPTVPVVVATNLITHGTIALNVTGSPLSLGQFALIAYTGTIGGNDFAAFATPTLPSGISGYLSNNVAGSSVDLVITSAPGYTWKGNINGDWDFSTQNWIDDATGFASAYQNGITRFPDDASSSNINVTTTFSPSAMIVSNSSFNYTFTGSGTVNSPTLRKQGSGVATFATTSASSFGRVDVDAGTLSLQYPSAATLTNIFAGPGNLIVGSSGTITMQGVSSAFTGNTLIQSGILKAGNGSALGATNGSITATNGATLDINDQGFGFKPIIVSGTGAGGLGAMIDSTTGTAIQIGSVNVSMVGDTTFGANGRWDIRAQAPTAGSPGLQGNGFKLTKVGNGFLSIASQGPANTYWFLNLGDIDVIAGTLTFAEQLNWGNTNKTVRISDAAGLNFYGLGVTNPAAGNVYMTNAFFRSDGGTDGTNIFAGPITLFGVTNTFDIGVPMIINAPISGSGILNKIGAGLLELNAANPFNDSFLVSTGLFGGTGSIAGSVIISSGTLTPGNSIGTSIGTLGVGGDLLATNKATFEINRSLSPNSDQVNVSGTITLGGTLTVTNLGAALQGGESFALFNKAISGSFTNLVLPTLTGGLSWINKLDVDGTLQVSGSSAPPQFGNISVNSGNVQLSGSGGTPGATYYVVASPDIAVALTNWTAVATNQFDGSGNFSASLPLVPSQSQLFYTLRLP